MSCAKEPCAGSLRHRIEIQRLRLEDPTPGTAEPRPVYATALSARCDIKTTIGVKEWSRVSIGGDQVTHKITMRWTSIPLDVRDRVRDVGGNLYRILAIENKDEMNRWLVLHCARAGAASLEAVQ